MASTQLKPVIKLSIENADGEHTSVFGPGIAALCRGVRDTGSLNAAAKHMGMAYSKAWRIVKDTEASISIQLLIRDGAHGSTLTPEANHLLDSYTELCKKLQTDAEKMFSTMMS
ncbi:MAG: LysR family transcriptional regulator [Eggerthellaceae bacterium]|jgi:molybdate transport system regulatory protein|nr:LysR family transcriptional regulator [Eggerthellaceae bacterium]MCH4221306.1 LysR family transcriptional regulator [Eggerthellaceae bacterium]